MPGVYVVDIMFVNVTWLRISFLKFYYIWLFYLLFEIMEMEHIGKPVLISDWIIGLALLFFSLKVWDCPDFMWLTRMYYIFDMVLWASQNSFKLYSWGNLVCRMAELFGLPWCIQIPFYWQNVSEFYVHSQAYSWLF